MFAGRKKSASSFMAGMTILAQLIFVGNFVPVAAYAVDEVPEATEVVVEDTAIEVVENEDVVVTSEVTESTDAVAVVSSTESESVTELAPEEAFPATDEVVVTEADVTTPESEAPPSEIVVSNPEEVSAEVAETTEEAVVEESTEAVTESVEGNEESSETVPEETVEETAPVAVSSSVSLSVSTPVLTTDKEDYHPGETATIFGKYFGSLQNIVLKIFGSDLGGENYTESIQNVTADAVGSFATTYTLDNIFRPYYKVIASNSSGAVLSETIFLDSGIAKYDQCSNDDGDGYATGDSGCRWTNGNLQPNNSTYYEGEATVQRAHVAGLTPGSHTILFKYGTTKGGKHAYDFLTTDTFSELAPNTVTDADFCEGLSGFPSCDTLIPNPSLLIPPDPNASGFDVAESNRYFKIRNGTITSVGAPTIVSGSYAGDSETTILVSFDVPSNCADKDTTANTCSVLITFGAHVSSQIDWGISNSAVNINGSPYHVAIDKLDGAAVGQRDNQMQSATVLQNSSITIVKDAVPNNAQDFSFTTTGTGLSNFSLDDDADGTLSNSQTFSGLASGVYTVDEGAVSGWSLTNLTCVDPTGNTTTNLGTGVATINLAAGESVTCTYTNTLQTGHIIVDKVTVPAADSQSFSFDAVGTGYNDFALTDVAAPNDQTLNTGLYSVSETLPAGWVQTSASCVSSIGDTETIGNLELDPGETITCTFTNTKQGKIIVEKQTNPGGTQAEFEFDPSYGNNFFLIDNQQNDSGYLAPGTYSVAEVNIPTGWSQSGVTCSDQSNPASINLSAGETVTCVFNNTQGGTLIVKKVMVGGTDTFNYTGTPSGSISINNGTISANVAPGAYNSTESALSGWDLTGLSCDDGNSTVNLGTRTATFNVEAGETVTCTFTNTKGGHIIVDKVTIPSGDLQSFDFTTNAGSNFALADETTPHDSGAVVPGTYSVAETPVLGWTQTGATCSDGSPVNAISLQAGETVTCTFTNTKLGTVIINKVTSGGDDTFAYTATGSELLSGFNITTSAGAGSQTFNNVIPGTKTVTETSPLSPWTFSNLVCSDPDNGSSVDTVNRVATIDVDAGETITCTYSNTKQPTLIVNKVLVPSNDTGRFNLKIDGITSGTGAEVGDGGTTGPVVVSIGSHTVSETAALATNLSDYTSVISGDCASDGSVSLAAGETKTCTITNTKKGTIVIEKQTLPNASVQSFGFTGEIVTSLNDDQLSSKQVVPGTYEVTESALAGWDLTGLSCSDGNSTGNVGTRTATFNVEPGEIVTCTFTNTERGHIIIQKNAVPDSNTQAFTFNNNFGNGNPATFQLTDTTAAGLPSYNAEVIPGKYAVTEDTVTGWQLDGTSCSSEETVNDIDVAPGETVTCTFTNVKLAKIILVKNTVGGNSTFDFSMTGTGLPSTDSISTVANTGSKSYENLDPDNIYSITETPIPTGWAKTGAVCDNGDPVTAITPNSGEVITCTFTNTKPVAQIDLTPLTATNKIGDDHVISVNVQTHNGDGAWGPASDGTIVTFSITNSNGATANFVGLNTCTTTAGTCSITINSPTAGHVVIHATASPVVLGVTLPVATNTGGDNSADATKDYVTARITITPSSDVNEVGDEHTFTVTVEKKTGLSWQPVSGAIVDGSVSPAPDSFDDTDCLSGTDGSGQCTIVLNSDDVGMFTVDAVTSINVGGVVFNLMTDGVGENSDGAVKYYVDAYITITPQTATNNITEPHEFVVTVTQVPGGATPAATANITYGVAPSPDSELTTCGPAVAFVGNTATCTITINNNTPNVFTATASAALTVGGVLLNRTTDGVGQNSVPAEKEYVAGALEVTKIVNLGNVVNPTAISDTFTVTVTGPSYPGGHNIVFNLVNGVLQAPTTVLLDNLIPGDYTVTEADAGLEWTETVPAGAVAVLANQTAQAEVTNTYVPGSLDVKKAIDLTGYPFASTLTDDFTFTVDGPSYPLGTDVVIHVVNGVVMDSPVTLNNLIPGNYEVEENDPGIAWSVTNGTNNVIVTAGGSVEAKTTNTIKLPHTTISISPSTWESLPGENVILTIIDTNDGDVPLTNPSVVLTYDAVILNLTKSSTEYVSGDTNDDGIMDPGEAWKWEVSVLISADTTFKVAGHGLDPYGNDISPENGYESEAGSIEVKVIGATRTIGFWQTHTEFTGKVFANELGGEMLIGTTISGHKGNITNIVATGQSQLFGAFYAPIANKTTGKGKNFKRDALDQARIQMLQQLVAAKLNCAAFGCGAATQLLIANSDAAYAGSDKNLIQSLTGQLDTYNNSGDSYAIPPELGASGKATPQASKALANLAFWDNP